MSGAIASRPIVFAGLSISVEDASATLDADYRPPIRRGDLADVPDGAVVLIIDGVFNRSLAVSPSEIEGSAFVISGDLTPEAEAALSSRAALTFKLSE